MCVVTAAAAEPVAVRFPESVTHGFLVLRSDRGEPLAHGELLQTPRGDRMDSRLVFRFTDGSLYDETVTFSQQRVFRLLSYRLVQRGKSFPSPADVSFDRASGRYKAATGERPSDRAEGALELPEDLYNGMASVLLKNLPAGAQARGHLLAFTPQPRLLRSTLQPEGTDRYVVGATAGKATRYVMRLEIGGVTGALAAVVGKSPPDVRYWITEGTSPGFVRFEGPMFLKGPTWRIELSAPRWPGER